MDHVGFTVLTWFGIFFCLSQSAMFSGLNLAFFSITRLRLEIEAEHQNNAAIKILKMRQNSNYLLTTILWGNVGINVLLTLLSDSVMAGLTAFIFSTILITLFGEIIPQAYFSRHALKMASLLSPILKFYQVLLYPVVKPSAKILDWWLGPESIQYFREKSLKQLIKKHLEDTDDIDLLEGIGAINFLSIDDLLVSEEGEPVDPQSIVSLPSMAGELVFPNFKEKASDEFIRKVDQSRKKWVILTDESGHPEFVMDSDGFLRSVLIDKFKTDPRDYCHRPVIVKNPSIPLGDVIKSIVNTTPDEKDDVIKQDVILLWSKRKLIITGADILGRLLKGISN